jgi:hypothetical protein
MMKNVYASLQESPEPGVYFSKDGILGHQFNKGLESFAPCYSQFLLLEDFKENHTFLWFLKSLQKNPRNRKA